MKKPGIILLILLVSTALLLSGCSSAKAPAIQKVTVAEESQNRGVAFAVPAAAPQAEMMSDTGSVYDATDKGTIERIVIKNADLSIVVAEPSAALDTIGKMAENMGGFIVSSQLYKTRTSAGVEVPAADITVRVPAERLNEAMDQIKALVKDPEQDILSENISGQDVTKEYTDLQSRLGNLQNAEKQLKEILESATKTEDVLNVYNQLTSVQEQIEVLKGQIKYYDEASHLSALHVNIQSEEAVQPLTIGRWKPVGVARDALQTLIDALKFIANAAIWVVIFCLPIGILVGVPAWFIGKGARRWWLKRKTKKQVEKISE